MNPILTIKKYSYQNCWSTSFLQNEISYQQRKSYLKGTHFVSFWRLMAEENIGGEERGGIKSDTKVHQSQSDDMMGDHLYVCRYSAVHTKQSHSHKCRNKKKDYHYSKYKIPSMTSLHYKNFVIFSRHGHFSKRTHTTSRIQICVKWLFQFHIAFKEKNDNFLRRQDNSDAQEKIAHVAPIFVDCIPSRTIKQRPIKNTQQANLLYVCTVCYILYCGMMLRTTYETPAQD